MGKKSDRRERRLALAQQREKQLFEAGLANDGTLEHLKSLSEEQLLAVQQRALVDIKRPSNPDKAAALVVLGALARLIRERQEAPA